MPAMRSLQPSHGAASPCLCLLPGLWAPDWSVGDRGNGTDMETCPGFNPDSLLLSEVGWEACFVPASCVLCYMDRIRCVLEAY